MTDYADEDLLTATDLAKYLGVTPRRLRQKIVRKLVPAPIRLAGSLRWKWRTIREWTEAVDCLHRLGIDLESIDEMEPEISGNLDTDSGNKRQSVTDTGNESGKSAKPR